MPPCIHDVWQEILQSDKRGVCIPILRLRVCSCDLRGTVIEYHMTKDLEGACILKLALSYFYHCHEKNTPAWAEFNHPSHTQPRSANVQLNPRRKSKPCWEQQSHSPECIDRWAHKSMRKGDGCFKSLCFAGSWLFGIFVAIADQNTLQCFKKSFILPKLFTDNC